MNEKKLEFYYGAASGSSRKALRKMKEQIKKLVEVEENLED